MPNDLSDSGFIAGDHLRVRRPLGNTHHGIYLGCKQIIDFGGADLKHKSAATVREVSLPEFEQNVVAEVMPYQRSRRLAPWLPEPLPRGETLARARFLLATSAPGRYDLLGHNCEHAATWCVTGVPESSQVRLGLYVNTGIGAGLGLLLAWAVRKGWRIPLGLVAAVVGGRLLLLRRYHDNQGRFVREIDRVWRKHVSSLNP